MAKHEHEHASIIDALGGSAVVAGYVGYEDSNRVSNWRQRGIPWAWRPTIAEWAKQRRVRVPADFLKASVAA